MDEIVNTNTTCSGGSEEAELIRELLDDESPFFMLPRQTINSSSSPSEDSLNDQLMSNLYSGPTMEDIESALSATKYRNHAEDIPQARISMLERGLSKAESKYTLRIKSWGNVMADDGYKWRKYGQKSIKNSPNPSDQPKFYGELYLLGIDPTKWESVFESFEQVDPSTT
ncbi:unnamed protein product [Ilex paraguariensis]|uniref:WRKY domain-containing protein n=1 Tax=Ilex paraguariensis TaxID=185542 RepID=A0ABC8UEV9_9AQUA